MAPRLSTTMLPTASAGANFDGNVCIPEMYVVPRQVLRRAFQRLDVVHSPGCPGQLRASILEDAIRRFDVTFGIDRRDEARAAVVAQLEEADEPGQVWWNAEELYSAFEARLYKRERIFFLVDVQDSSTVLSMAITIGLVTTIFLSIVVWMVSTMPEFCRMECDTCPPEPQPWMEALDDVCVYVFTTEFLARLLTVSAVRDELLKPHFIMDLIGAQQESTTPIATGRRKLWSFLKSPYSVIDLLAVLPYWLEIATSQLVDPRKLVWLRLFRMLRLSRVFKLLRLLNWDLGSLGEANYLLVQVSRRALPACGIFIGLIAIALVVFSGVIFTLERGDWYPMAVLEVEGLLPEEPGQFYRTSAKSVEVSPFHSIPSSAWWTLVTITTVGYGDVVPVTTAGKALAFVAILYGAVLLGLPVGIIGAQFEIEFSRLASASMRREEAGRRRRSLLINRVIKAASSLSLGTTSPRQRVRMRSRTNSSWGSTVSVSTFGGPRRSDTDLVSADANSASERQRVARQTEEFPPFSVEIESLSPKVGSTQPGPVPDLAANKMSSKGSIGRMIKVRTNAVKRACAARAAQRAEPKRYGLEMNSADYTRLMEARYALEDMLRLHAHAAGITEQQTSSWLQDLSATQYCAGPALDRLGARILTRLAEEEKVRKGSETSMLRIRQAWHELCIVCCQVADVTVPAPEPPPPERRLPRLGLRPFRERRKGKSATANFAGRLLPAPVLRARSLPAVLRPTASETSPQRLRSSFSRMMRRI